MHRFRDYLDSRYFIWILLGIPALPVIADFYYDQRYYAELMYDTGVFSVQLLVFNLALTPLRNLTRSIGPMHFVMRWLYRQRRYIGVASFAYALLHTLVYLRRTEDLINVVDQLRLPEISVGWIALLIFLAMAVTSNNMSTRVLGVRWKKLHRLVYVGTMLTALHWLLFGFFTSVLFLCFIPMLLLQIPRILHQIRGN